MRRGEVVVEEAATDVGICVAWAVVVVTKPTAFQMCKHDIHDHDNDMMMCLGFY